MTIWVDMIFFHQSIVIRVLHGTQNEHKNAQIDQMTLLFSFMLTLQTYYHFKLYFQKVDQQPMYTA